MMPVTETVAAVTSVAAAIAGRDIGLVGLKDDHDIRKRQQTQACRAPIGQRLHHAHRVLAVRPKSPQQNFDPAHGLGERAVDG
jgi:hypothetical protein